MIKLELEDYCHGNCMAFEPKVVFGDAIYCSNEVYTYTDTVVKCENHARCKQIVRYLKKQMDKEAKCEKSN